MLQLSFPPSHFSCLCPCSSHLRGLGVRLLHWDREGNSQEVSVFIGKKPQRFFQPVKWAHHPLATTQQSLDGHCEGPRAGRYFQQHSQTPALLSSVPGHPKCSPHKHQLCPSFHALGCHIFPSHSYHSHPSSTASSLSCTSHFSTFLCLSKQK